MARNSKDSEGAATTQAESRSTLAQIREKELEVDGQVMKARAEAEQRLDDARKRAAEARAAAEDHAERVVQEHESEVLAAAQHEAAAERAASAEEIARLDSLSQSRQRAAVDEVLKAVLG